MTSRNERAEASANVAEMHKAPFAPCRRARAYQIIVGEGGLTMIRGLVVLCVLACTNVAAPAQSPPGNLSPAQFDLACAMVTGAEMGASQNEKNSPRRDMAITIFTFYIGRLSGRDDSKDWNAIVRGHAVELQQQARSQKMFDTCLDFYTSKIK